MEDRLGGILAEAVQRGRVVGAVLVLLQDGAELHADIAGSMDRERDIAVQRATIFRLAGMTKPIVSAAALSLIDSGLLSLDDPVSRYLPRFRPRLAEGGEPTVTIRHLITHTAGLSYGFLQPMDGPYARAGVSDGLDQPALGLAENLGRLASAPLLHAPGSAWSDSLATDVLGAVLQEAAAAALADIVRARITDPLGMSDTGFVAAEPRRLAKPYADAGVLPPVASPDAIQYGAGVLRLDPRRALARSAYASGGGGMVGTADDYTRFLEALRRGGDPILRPQTAKSMLADAIGGLATDRPGLGFGLGIAVLRDPSAATVGMPAGSLDGGGAWGTRFWVDPVERLTMVLLTNTAPGDESGGSLAATLRDAVWPVGSR